MNLLTMEHITKSYTDRVLLDDVPHQIPRCDFDGYS